ncbi:hypothetical protein A6A04_01365 [Paramagnetospirillum marisnigri]|uniref:Divergent polysaccharide deacetylase family protein n=1 Tax=Paramagnetospirillum marisnigri TaxID=1285242 RepID=A0A178MU71_9PROT|nr:divergent polysaccharide deacetylase family protein [Paramagnetospirillum marisnigri]OAN52367.1 hypothetical protein A6A04_01365 [Paramagnetospirillum marisnigri]
MASDRHDDLDELDEEPSFEIVVDEPVEKKPINFKPFLMGLLVLVLGGGLGGAVYLATAFEARDLIGLLDIGESPPKLSMALPGFGDAAKSAPEAGRGGGLLTPPGAVGGSASSGEMLKAIPDDTPPPDHPDAAPSPRPDTAAPVNPDAPPAQAPTPAAAPPPASAPAAPVDDELARLEAGSSKPLATAPKTPVLDATGIPSQPSPRSAEKQPPSFDTLATPKGEMKPLLLAPVKELLRKTQVGDLPYPSPDGRQPWQVYARPWSGPADKGKVAVVVMDLGLDKTATEAAIAKLPPEVTLAFSPYAPSLDKWIKKARDFGHEVLLMLPAEGPGYPSRDPGPLGLISALSPEVNLTRLENVLSKAQGYSGVISLGGVYGASPLMGGTLAALKEHGLLYLGDGTAAADRAPPLARVVGVVDTDPFKEAIDMRLNQVSIQARTKGQAVAVVNARPLSFHRLMAWINDLDGQNLVLAPASTVVQQAASAGKS